MASSAEEGTAAAAGAAGSAGGRKGRRHRRRCGAAKPPTSWESDCTCASGKPSSRTFATLPTNAALAPKPLAGERVLAHPSAAPPSSAGWSRVGGVEAAARRRRASDCCASSCAAPPLESRRAVSMASLPPKSAGTRSRARSVGSELPPTSRRRASTRSRRVGRARRPREALAPRVGAGGGHAHARRVELVGRARGAALVRVVVALERRAALVRRLGARRLDGVPVGRVLQAEPALEARRARVRALCRPVAPHGGEQPAERAHRVHRVELGHAGRLVPRLGAQLLGRELAHDGLLRRAAVERRQLAAHPVHVAARLAVGRRGEPVGGEAADADAPLALERALRGCERLELVRPQPAAEAQLPR